MLGPRRVVHVDLDAFFAAVEQRDNPALRGQPVLVGGSVTRGVVAAASYEARRFGVHSAMSMAHALRLCPQAIVVGHRFDRYVEASRQFFAILEEFSPVVESLSLDEGFVDITGGERLLGSSRQVGTAIRKKVREGLNLVASVGVAPSKFVAKIASDIDKPDGLRIVAPDDVLAFLHPLPIARLWGVGKVAQETLNRMGISTIGDVANYPEQVLVRRLGSLGAHVAALSRGEDNRPVAKRDRPVSIGQEDTFPTDIGDSQAIASLLRGQADQVASRLRRSGYRATVVAIKIKYGDFRLVSRQRALTDSTSDGNLIGEIATALLRELEIRNDCGKSKRVRLCGVAVSKLVSREAPRQLVIEEEKRSRGERLGETLDAIADRFGASAVTRAVGSRTKTQRRSR